MGTLRATSHLWILGQTLLLAGALPWGCDRIPANPPEPHAPQAEATPRVLSATVPPSTAAPSPSPSMPGSDGLDEFKQALVQKLYARRLRAPGTQPSPHELPATPQGGILHMPEGQDIHAAILVKSPDGTVRKECVSSPAEVSALVEDIRKGRTP